MKAMPKRTAMAVVAVMLSFCVSCSKAEDSKGAAALEKAYKAGVLTKEEYETRKARLGDTAAKLAALEKARAEGVLTNDEYEAKKSALLAAREPVPEIPSTATHASSVSAGDGHS